MLFELLVMRYKAVLAQPTPWIKDTIGSNLFLHFIEQKYCWYWNFASHIQAPPDHFQA
jgi:hypothetical protein